MKTSRPVCPVLAVLLAATTTLLAQETQLVDIVVVPDRSGRIERAIEDDGLRIQHRGLTDKLDEALAELMEPTLGGGEELVGRALTSEVDDDDDLLECEGDGLIHVVSDECMNDGGDSAAGDSLEVYCHLGIARFCLSGEECPWREAPVGKGDETCSRAGLATEWMASAWCEGWSDFDYFSCTALGEIKLETRR